MEKELVVDITTGEETFCYPLAWFMAECAEYTYDRVYRQFLGVRQSEGLSPTEAIVQLKEKLGARTRRERRDAWQAQLQEWREIRENKARRGRGRPAKQVELGELKTALAAAVFKVLAGVERRPLSPDSRALVEGIRRQLSQW